MYFILKASTNCSHGARVAFCRPFLNLLEERKRVRGRAPGLGNLGGVLGGPMTNNWGRSHHISLYLSPKIPSRFPSPGSLPPTGFTFLQLATIRLQRQGPFKHIGKKKNGTTQKSYENIRNAIFHMNKYAFWSKKGRGGAFWDSS